MLSCDNTSKNQDNKYQQLKAYVQDSLNEQFNGTNHYYVLIAKGGCGGCIANTFEFFMDVKVCKNLTIITNSSFLTGEEKAQIENNVAGYYFDPDPNRLNRLNLQVAYKPSVVSVKNDQVDTVVNLNSRHVVNRVLNGLSCTK